MAYSWVYHMHQFFSSAFLKSYAHISADVACSRIDWLTVELETTKKPSGKAGRVKEQLLKGAKFVSNTAAKSEPLDQT